MKIRKCRGRKKIGQVRNKRSEDELRRGVWKMKKEYKGKRSEKKNRTKSGRKRKQNENSLGIFVAVKSIFDHNYYNE